MANSKDVRAKRPVSLHQQILSDIEENILSGKWPPGFRIPFEHELVEQYQCSRMTVNKVLTQLVGRKLIERRRRVGSFVTKPHSSSAVLEIVDIKAEVEGTGRPYRYEIKSRRKKAADTRDRQLLEVQEGSPILRLAVRHYAGAAPFCFEERLISLIAAPEAADEQFEDLPPGSWLVQQVPWSVAEHRIRAVAVPADAAAALNIAPGTPGLVIERRTWSADRAVTFVRLTYPGDEHELVAHFNPAPQQRGQKRAARPVRLVGA
jgi:GntR family histidine utilization transcriptional repressor